MLYKFVFLLIIIYEYSACPQKQGTQKKLGCYACAKYNS